MTLLGCVHRVLIYIPLPTAAGDGLADWTGWLSTGTSPLPPCPLRIIVQTICLYSRKYVHNKCRPISTRERQHISLSTPASQTECLQVFFFLLCQQPLFSLLQKGKEQRPLLLSFCRVFLLATCHANHCCFM